MKTLQVQGRQARPSRQQQLDGIGEVLVCDVVLAALNAQTTGRRHSNSASGAD